MLANIINFILLPKVRTPRNASIPYVWSKDDIKKLLSAIDRDDPKGKRRMFAAIDNYPQARMSYRNAVDPGMSAISK